MPNKSDFVIANDAVPVLRRLSTSESEHPLAIYLGESSGRERFHEVSDPQGQKFFIGSTPDLDERDVASVEYGVRGDLPAIKLIFNNTGAKRFQDLTRRSVGKPVLFVASGKVLMAPIIENVSTDSYVWITTGLSEKEVRALFPELSSALSRSSSK